MTDRPRKENRSDATGVVPPARDLSSLGAEWPKTGVGSRPTTVLPKERLPKRVLATIGFVLDSTRRRRSGRMFLSSIVLIFALGGLSLLFYPVITDVWADRLQDGLEQQFEAQDAEAARVAYQQKAPIKEGSALTRIVIPKLRVNVIVVEGTSGNALRAGAGHFIHSALPGDPGNVAIAGHRTGFGEPFRNVHRLKTGDRIELRTPFGTFVYAVSPSFDGHKNPWVTHARDWSVTEPTPQPSLTIVTCDPPGTSDNRLIVRAHLVASPSRA